jgi:hypothetical protein
MTTEDLTGMGKAIAPLTEGISQLCAKLLSKPADEVGGLLAEWVDVRLRPWRMENLLRSLEKTNEVLVRRGIEPRLISNHKLVSSSSMALPLKTMRPFSNFGQVYSHRRCMGRRHTLPILES